MNPNLKKYLNRSINIVLLIVQVGLLVLALEQQGIFLILFILLQIAWGAWWSYNNWWILITVKEVFLSNMIGRKYLEKKIKDSKK